MPSPGMRGWYVELDEKLVAEFERLFPEHGSKAKLTTAAVVTAIQMFGNEDAWRAMKLMNLVTLTPGGDDVSRQRRNQASDDLSPGSDISEAEGG